MPSKVSKTRAERLCRLPVSFPPLDMLAYRLPPKRTGPGSEAAGPSKMEVPDTKLDDPAKVQSRHWEWMLYSREYNLKDEYPTFIQALNEKWKQLPQQLKVCAGSKALSNNLEYTIRRCADFFTKLWYGPWDISEATLKETSILLRPGKWLFPDVHENHPARDLRDETDIERMNAVLRSWLERAASRYDKVKNPLDSKMFDVNKSLREYLAASLFAFSRSGSDVVSEKKRAKMQQWLEAKSSRTRPAMKRHTLQWHLEAVDEAYRELDESDRNKYKAQLRRKDNTFPTESFAQVNSDVLAATAKKGKMHVLAFTLLTREDGETCISLNEFGSWNAENVALLDRLSTRHEAWNDIMGEMKLFASEYVNKDSSSDIRICHGPVPRNEANEIADGFMGMRSPSPPSKTLREIEKDILSLTPTWTRSDSLASKANALQPWLLKAISKSMGVAEEYEYEWDDASETGFDTFFDMSRLPLVEDERLVIKRPVEMHDKHLATFTDFILDSYEGTLPDDQAFRLRGNAIPDGLTFMNRRSRSPMSSPIGESDYISDYIDLQLTAESAPDSRSQTIDATQCQGEQKNHDDSDASGGSTLNPLLPSPELQPMEDIRDEDHNPGTNKRPIDAVMDMEQTATEGEPEAKKQKCDISDMVAEVKVKVRISESPQNLQVDGAIGECRDIKTELEHNPWA